MNPLPRNTTELRATVHNEWQSVTQARIRRFSLFVSLLSHFWPIHFFSPTPALSTISRPLSSSMCSITPETANVGSSYNRMRGPGIGCWVSERSNCSRRSLTLTFTLTSENLSLYTTLLHLLVLIQLSWLQLLSYKVKTITAEVCNVAAAIASASVGDVPVGYSTFHVDLAS